MLLPSPVAISTAASCRGGCILLQWTTNATVLPGPPIETRPHRGRYGKGAQISVVDLKLATTASGVTTNGSHRTHRDAPMVREENSARPAASLKRAVKTSGWSPNDPAEPRAVEENPMMPPIGVNPTMASRTASHGGQCLRLSVRASCRLNWTWGCLCCRTHHRALPELTVVSINTVPQAFNRAAHVTHHHRTSLGLMVVFQSSLDPQCKPRGQAHQ